MLCITYPSGSISYYYFYCGTFHLMESFPQPLKAGIIGLCNAFIWELKRQRGSKCLICYISSSDTSGPKIICTQGKINTFRTLNNKILWFLFKGASESGVEKPFAYFVLKDKKALGRSVHTGWQRREHMSFTWAHFVRVTVWGRLDSLTRRSDIGMFMGWTAGCGGACLYSQHLGGRCRKNKSSMSSMAT